MGEGVAANGKSLSRSELDDRVAHLVLVDIQSEIAAGQFGLYLSALRRPFFFSRVRGLTPLNHHAFDRPCGAWVSQFAFQRHGRILPRLVTDRICQVLAGREPLPRPENVPDGDEMSAVADAPFVGLVVAFFEKQRTPTYEKRVGEFLDALRVFALDNRSHAHQRAVPSSASWLGRLLSEYRNLLLACGIDVERRVSDGKWIKLSKVPDRTAVVQSSVESAQNTAKSSAEASTDGIRDRIRARLHNERAPEQSGDVLEGKVQL